MSFRRAFLLAALVIVAACSDDNGDGGQEPAEGDILVRPASDDPERVLVELNAPTGFAILSAVAEDVAAFLDSSYDVVQPGEEDLWIDFDRELQKLVSTID